MAQSKKNFFIFCLLLMELPALARISADAPTYVGQINYYEMIDRLEAFGCAAQSFRTFRPLPYQVLSKSLESIYCNAPESVMKDRDTLLKSMPHSARLSTLLISNDRVSLNGIDANVMPLFPMMQGRPTVHGANLFAEASATLEVGHELGVAFGITPGWVGALEDYKSALGRFYLQEAYAKIGYRQLELSFGRMLMGFGDARHGTLAFSGASAPYNGIKLTLLPHVIEASPLNYLGSFSFQAWLFGEGNPTFKRDIFLLGVGLGMRPSSWFDFSLMEIFQFAPLIASLSFSDYLRMLTYSGATDLDAKRNRAMVAHFNFWLPPHFLKLYVQFFFEKLRGNWFADDINALVGLWFPHVWGGDIRLEYVNTVPNAYQYGFLNQGLTYKQTPFGHPIGPDSEGFYVDINFPHVWGWRPGIGFLYEARGEHTIAPERRYGGELEILRQVGDFQFQLSGRAAYAKNHFQQSGKNAFLIGVWGLVSYSYTL